jgi:tetratricopeptide (TPR) repeat protein
MIAGPDSFGPTSLLSKRNNASMRVHCLRILALLSILLNTACDQADTQQTLTSDAPAKQVATTAETGDGFADNVKCLHCHQQQASAWSGSHHDLAMGEVNASNVLGNFSDAEFTHAGVTSRFRVEDGRYIVNTEGPDGEHRDYEISYTFGVEPLQQYLVELDGGRLQALTVAWDSRPAEQGGQRWFQLQPEDEAPPGDPLHWTGRMHNWNVRCAECHSTNLKKNFDPATRTYDTRWSEINVSCQACHGPGAAHVEWAETGQGGEQVDGYGLVNGELDSRALVDSCARCHSRRHRVSPDDAHGRALLDDFEPATLQSGLYHPDGQILDEVYVYGSFLQSRMYDRGVGCTDCHDAHSAHLKLAGNALCQQCHSAAPPARFPTLQKKDYASPAHHFHAEDSAGAQCVNCHMTATTYMEIDPRRDHSFRIPRPDLTVKLGVPNACNQCHTDQSPEWAADRTAEWYGTEIRDTTHYGEVFAAARDGAADAYEDLVKLSMDESQPAIVTATAVQLLARYGATPVAADSLRSAAAHPDPLVRTVATSTLGLLPELADLKTLTRQLNDPVRAVRIEAARILAPIPRQHLDDEQRRALDSALQEYRDTQLALSDTPEALLNLGVLASALGDETAAEVRYAKALEIAPEFVPVRVNLANLYNRTGRNRLAEEQLRAAIGYQPEAGELYYSLGLLLVETQRYTEAAGMLREASERLPRRARVHYNYGLLLQQLSRRDEAQLALQQAYELQPQDPDVVYALVVFYTQGEDWSSALDYARRLQSLAPDNTDTARLLQQLERASAGTADN